MRVLPPLLLLCAVLLACNAGRPSFTGTYIQDEDHPECGELTLYPDHSFVFTHCDEIRGSYRDTFQVRGDTLYFPWVPGIQKLDRLLLREDQLYIVYSARQIEAYPSFQLQSRKPKPSIRPGNIR